MARRRVSSASGVLPPICWAEASKTSENARSSGNPARLAMDTASRNADSISGARFNVRSTTPNALYDRTR